MTFSAATVPASEALTWGLVDAVAADEAELDAKIADMIKRFRRGSLNAIAMIKEALRTGDEIAAFGRCFEHADSKEGMAAFMEKRPASWMEG
jgi:enoyl-CoA hydratase/carnithine racemase